MKNIETIITEIGIELTDEQKEKLVNGVKDNYKAINDYQKQIDKLQAQSTTIEQLQEQLKSFEGVDPQALNSKIAELNKTIEDNEAEYKRKIEDRDFTDAVKGEIAKAKGKNEKAIMALLDIDTLKASKNQTADIEAAIKALTEAEDSKMLFGEAQPQVVGTGNVIGNVGGGSVDADLAAMRALMGLPPEKE